MRILQTPNYYLATSGRNERAPCIQIMQTSQLGRSDSNHYPTTMILRSFVRKPKRIDRLRAFCFIQASVRYLLRVKLDSTNAVVRRTCHDCGFVVLKPLDLNTIHQMAHHSWPSDAASSSGSFDPLSQKPLPPADVSRPDGVD